MLHFLYITCAYAQGAKWKKLRLIEINIRKTLQASAFSLIVLNLTEKAVLHILLIMVDYVQNSLPNKQQITSKAENF